VTVGCEGKAPCMLNLSNRWIE